MDMKGVEEKSRRGRATETAATPTTKATTTVSWDPVRSGWM